ncbi:SPOSA6832_04089 [Sporobolomyces salmonicolor]|uniref:SPOSA6832_04089-mRNA-1:cds n=1 Tax=Sporidiobolus salmonicolor TaxID=5005 RepID=A0A0D6EQG0_SPOSA|nr:SPOSA6832_04089 [Sporobolomyces salmonicolor]
MSDPYTAKAASDASPSEKISEFKDKIMAEAKFAMLTTRAHDGTLHSRAMSPASSQGLVFSFIANTDSGKFDELEHDENVNVSWSDPSTTDWASAAGKAKVIKDVEVIKKLWHPALKAWFGDKKDGVHNGEPEDPRVAVLEVIPSEWVKTRTSLGQTVEVLKGAVTGETASPGHLRVISAKDLELARQVDSKQI